MKIQDILSLKEQYCCNGWLDHLNRATSRNMRKLARKKAKRNNKSLNKNVNKTIKNIDKNLDYVRDEFQNMYNL